MKNIVALLILISIFSCQKEEQRDLTVKVNIEGLKKGIIYLKKAQDTALIVVDSIYIDHGNSIFELHSDLNSPEIFYLTLDKKVNEQFKIPFFANRGITEISTSLKNFEIDANINGSEQQKTLEEYKKMISRFNERNLELIKENFEAQRDQDSAKLNANETEYNNLLKRKYLYTVNFAISHKDSEVAPYLALSEIYDANVKWLDTINNSLSPEVKDSKYGKELQSFIEKIKESEK
ncbi:DUF4369 domain-containing protein [Yeosuana sp. MJ-SS3]|uniref:DUF4369 domain-containing protein n=1 Tax=Gilvirhabdus luticola TaxID=3079858 RepID=A0ABU3U583_9FLAO|nr:DUF4369 domain-containing protein [Yeosuana sp. MJ-SS3]MDU8885575.1 DUF4369 domain-containing protein [Yeosuana sp. MJ-SS3]